MTTKTTLIKSSNGEVIVPKTRSNWITRTNNANYEDNLIPITSKIKSGIIYDCIHSKNDTIHNITNLPNELPSVCSIRFKANGDYADGDTFLIHNTTYTVGNFTIEDNKITRFKNGAIAECDIDNSNRIVYLKSKLPLIIPYKPIDPPQFTYTGTYQTDIEADVGYKIKFLSSGTFTLLDPESISIDVFLVGGGGGGSVMYSSHSGSGGGGGYTKTLNQLNMLKNQKINISIGTGGIKGSSSGGNGGSGGNSVYASNIVNGGKGATSTYPGGDGGSGGASAYADVMASLNKPGPRGGDNGSNGGNSDVVGGKGQGTTTGEFGNKYGILYAGGGGAGGGYVSNISEPGQSGGYGGSGGGGKGGNGWNSPYYTGHGTNGTQNTGGGGGGCGTAASNQTQKYGGDGGSGIVIIRNTRTAIT